MPRSCYVLFLVGSWLSIFHDSARVNDYGTSVEKCDLCLFRSYFHVLSCIHVLVLTYGQYMYSIGQSNFMYSNFKVFKVFKYFHVFQVLAFPSWCTIGVPYLTLSVNLARISRNDLRVSASYGMPFLWGSHEGRFSTRIL